MVHKENSSALLWGGRDFCGVITGKAQVETPLCLVIYTVFCFKTAGQARLDLLNAAACLQLIYFPLRIDVTFFSNILLKALKNVEECILRLYRQMYSTFDQYLNGSWGIEHWIIENKCALKILMLIKNGVGVAALVCIHFQ